MLTITSKENQYLHLLRALQQKKTRQEEKLFTVEGLRVAEEAARYADVAFALFAEGALADARMAALAEQLTACGAQVFAARDDLFARAAATEHPQGVLVACHIKAQIRPKRGGKWYAYCDTIADPGNLGTILRSAAATGCAAMLLSPGCADLYNPKTVRAAMGALFRLPCYVCADEADALTLLAALEAAPLATAADGRDIRTCQDLLAKPHCWILGAEAHGISATWRKQALATIALPMVAGVESINVASAAAVLFYQSFFTLC